MKWPAIWKPKSTPSGRRTYQLSLDRRAMKDSDYGLWHTPTTMMIVETPERFRARMNRKRSNDRKNGLPNLAVQAIWVNQALGGSLARTGSSDQLNPVFLCWLMGFPDVWTSNAPTATPLFPASPPPS